VVYGVATGVCTGRLVSVVHLIVPKLSFSTRGRPARPASSMRSSPAYGLFDTAVGTRRIKLTALAAPTEVIAHWARRGPTASETWVRADRAIPLTS